MTYRNNWKKENKNRNNNKKTELRKWSCGRRIREEDMWSREKRQDIPPPPISRRAPIRRKKELMRRELLGQEVTWTWNVEGQGRVILEQK